MFFTAGVDKLSLHFVPCVPSSVQSIPLHSVLPEHAVWQSARVVDAAFGRVLRTFVFAQEIQRTQPVPTKWRYIIKHFRRKARALRDGDVNLFVCSFVRLFVWRQRVLVGHWPDCPAAQQCWLQRSATAVMGYPSQWRRGGGWSGRPVRLHCIAKSRSATKRIGVIHNCEIVIIFIIYFAQNTQ